jgi:hypothetical protein
MIIAKIMDFKACFSQLSRNFYFQFLAGVVRGYAYALLCDSSVLVI